MLHDPENGVALLGRESDRSNVARHRVHNRQGRGHRVLSAVLGQHAQQMMQFVLAQSHPHSSSITSTPFLISADVKEEPHTRKSAITNVNTVMKRVDERGSLPRLYGTELIGW